MGSGASAGLEAALKVSSVDEVAEACKLLDAGNRERLQQMLTSSIPSVTLVPGVTATAKAREWRCKFTDGSGSGAGLINSKSLEEAQQLLSQTIAKVKAVDGVQCIRRIVCGECKDFKVITVVAVNNPWDTWKKSGFPPESEFLEKLSKIDGISQVESQTYTFEVVATNFVTAGDTLTLVPGVETDTLGREWRCKFTPSEEPPASGVMISSKSLEAALKALDETLEQLKALPSVSSIARTVCGGKYDFKISVAMPLKEFSAWEEKAFAPEEEFLEKLKAIEGIHSIEAQKYTCMGL